jgi:MFS family permease
MYSISTNFFPEHKDAMVGYIEAVTGVGLILGPLIGSGLYALGGYRFIFFSFGSLFVVASFFIKAVFGPNIDAINTSSNESASKSSGRNSYRDDDFKPARTNQQRLRIERSNSYDEECLPSSGEILKQRQAEEESKVVIGTFELLKYPRFFFAALSGTLGYFLYGFMEPILAFRIEKFELT